MAALNETAILQTVDDIRRWGFALVPLRVRRLDSTQALNGKLDGYFMKRSKRFALAAATVTSFSMGMALSGIAEPNPSGAHRLYDYSPQTQSPTFQSLVLPTRDNQAITEAACGDCFSWDIDASGRAEPLTDGLIILRYLFGFSDQSLVSGVIATGATRTNAPDITAYLEVHAAELDIDNDGELQPLTDGLLLLRYLFGFSEASLIDGAISQSASRPDATDISAYLSNRLPSTQNLAPAILPPAWDFTVVLPSQVGSKAAAVDDLVDYIFADAAVQSTLVTKDGYIIGERYRQGFDTNSLGTSWSVAKSFYSAAIGAALADGLIESVDQKASEIITEWQGTDKADITLHDMLQMRSGYSASDEVFLAADQTTYAINRPVVRDPGSRFAYSNANSQLFEPILRRVTGMSAHDYLSEKILTPIDIDVTKIGLWLDSTGVNPLTYCCIDMPTIDFARFGLLYARDGEWRGNQIVPQEYVKSSLIANGWYGYQWWIMNSAYFSGQSVPIEIAAAQGLDGQFIFVWPDQDIVVVVLTQYSHAVEQGYQFNLSGIPLNYPDTCTARNNCPGASRTPVPSFGHLGLVERVAQLVDAR